MSGAISRSRDTLAIKEFAELLRSLGFGSYSEYLASPLWRSIRQRVYEAKGRVCVSCEINAAEDIHHDRYDRDTLVGKTLKYLRPLCRHCHEIVHGDARWTPQDHGFNA